MEIDKSLLDNEEKFRLLHENAGIGIGFYKLDGTVISFNQKAAQNMGGQPEDFDGKSIYDLFPRKEAEFYHQRIKESASSEQSLIFEDKLNLPIGEVFYLSTFTKIVDTNKKIIGIQIISQNITDQKQIQEALNENKARLELAMRVANMSWWAMDLPTGNVIFEKHKAEMLGYPPEKFTHYKDFMALLHPEDHDKAMDAMYKHLAGKVERYEVEYRILTKSGEYRWFYDIGSIVKRDINGKPITFTGLVIDITQRKKAEEKIKESEERYRLLFSTMREGFAYHQIVTNEQNKPIDYIFLEINDAFEHLTGLKRENVIGKKVSVALPGTLEDPTDWVQIYGNVALTGNSVAFESYCTVLKKWFLISAYSPRVGYFATLFQDITLQKQNQIELQDSKYFLDKIINSVASPIFVKNDHFEFCLVNDALCALLNLSREKLIGSTGYENFPEDQNKVFLAKDREVLKTGKENVNEELITDGVGNIRTIVTKKTLFTESAGDKFLVGIINDVTERKQAEEVVKKVNITLEQRVQQRTQDLQNSNQELQDFAYAIAHEIRAPLRAIHGYSQLLEEDLGTKLTNEEKRKLDLIRSNSRRMDQLITDLLGMAKISRTKLTLELLPMKETIESVLNEQLRLVDQSKIEIRWGDIPDGWGDKLLIRQVWTNLIENALKFSSTKDKQIITLQGTIQGDDVIYSIQDNGCGFNPAYINKLFIAFNRLQPDNAYEGTGIGLAIVERIIQRHGGTVWAEGVEGVGATFYFSLPKEMIDG